MNLAQKPLTEIDMTEERHTLAELFAECWKDDALKARFIADPKSVLTERGFDVLDGIDIKVVENGDDCVHITLPSKPSTGADVSDGELSAAFGGHTCSLTVVDTCVVKCHSKGHKHC